MNLVQPTDHDGQKQARSSARCLVSNWLVSGQAVRDGGTRIHPIGNNSWAARVYNTKLTTS